MAPIVLCFLLLIGESRAENSLLMSTAKLTTPKNNVTAVAASRTKKGAIVTAITGVARNRVVPISRFTRIHFDFLPRRCVGKLKLYWPPWYRKVRVERETCPQRVERGQPTIIIALYTFIGPPDAGYPALDYRVHGG